MEDDDISLAGTLGEAEQLAVVMADLEARSQRFGAALTGALRSAAAGGKGLEDVLRGLGSRLSDIALSAGLKPLENALGRAIGGMVGSVVPFAEGGVVRSPSFFPMGGGDLGLMGEAGAEAILPLKRGPDGGLGVAAAGGGAAAQIIFNVTATDAASFRRSEGQITAMLAAQRRAWPARPLAIVNDSGGDAAMTGFHEIRFPLRLALGTSGGPVRRTDIVNLSNGRENRNARWRGSRRSYDAGSGIRSLADLYAVLEFFEARGGRLNGFRFRDPLDATSRAPGEPVTATDQVIGTGDGTTARFSLCKTYGDAGGGWVRAIAKPVAGSVLVSVDGVAKAPASFAVDATTGLVTFVAGHVPGPGAVVRAGFAFDVPVRFDTDRIEVNLAHFDAGRIPTIPLTEIMP